LFNGTANKDEYNDVFSPVTVVFVLVNMPFIKNNTVFCFKKITGLKDTALKLLKEFQVELERVKSSEENVDTVDRRPGSGRP